MNAFKHLFLAARHDIIAQIDDDVIRLSSGIAEHAAAIFDRHPEVQQIVADVWQDSWTNGSRPAMSQYALYDATDGLYEGRIDGWFSLYRRSMLPTLMRVPYKKYQFIGLWARQLLMEQGLKGLLCTKFKVLHLADPNYAFLFDQLDSEIEKYRFVGRDDMVANYELAKTTLSPRTTLEQALQNVFRAIDVHHLLG